MNLEQLVDEARQRTGLTRFHTDAFEAPCRHLIRSLLEDADLTAAGLEAQRERIVESLSNNLRLTWFLEHHPDIEDQEIAAPLVIVGLPRTGSTLLQRLLAQDAGIDSMHWYEGRFPIPLSDDFSAAQDPRLARARLEIGAILYSAPEIDSIQPIDPLEADEEIMLLEHTFFSTMPESMANVHSYGRWLEQQDHRPAYAQLRTWLRFLQWQKRRNGDIRSRWVLKTPHHVHQLGALLDLFPDAVIIQTHRDPLAAIPSVASMISSYWQMISDSVDRHYVGRYWNDKFARSVADMMAVRDAHPEVPFIDLRYEDIAHHPLATLHDLYRQLDRQLTPDTLERANQWLATNTRDSRPPHRYRPEDFGLSQVRIAASFRNYIERFIE